MHRIDARLLPQLRREEQRSSSRQQHEKAALKGGSSAEARLRPPGFGPWEGGGGEAISTVLFTDRQTDARV